MFFVYRFWYLLSVDNRVLNECKTKEIVLAIERSYFIFLFGMFLKGITVSTK